MFAYILPIPLLVSLSVLVLHSLPVSCPRLLAPLLASVQLQQCDVLEKETFKMNCFSFSSWLSLAAFSLCHDISTATFYESLLPISAVIVEIQ